MKIYRCGIIGLGRQGAGIPEPYPVDKPRSHKEAYEMHPRCKLIMGRDFHPHMDRNFGEWTPKNFNSIEIWSVCVPAKLHRECIDNLLNKDACHSVRAIFCEKPLAPTLHECDEIISFCKQAQVVLAVNHQRAWEEHGEVVYRGDVLETGTHAAEVASRHEFSLRQDRSLGEPQISIQLRGHGPGVSLAALDDVIRCIEGGRERPRCDGWVGREAVRIALTTAPAPVADFEGGTSGGETRGRSVVLAEAKRVSPAV